MKFFLTPPGSFRPAAIVDTVPAITELNTQELRTLMYERSCANGMLVDPTTCLTLRDTFENMGPQSVREDLRLNTDEVLRLVQGTTLDERVETWLARLSVSWDHALPPDASVAELLHDFVPAAIGTELHIVGGHK